MTRLILKISRKVLTRSPVNGFAQMSLKVTAARHNKWTQFPRRCYRGFPCFREPLTNAKESQKMYCWKCSQLRIGSWKKSYLTTRSSHMCNHLSLHISRIPVLAGFGFCLLLHRLAVRISLPFHIFLACSQTLYFLLKVLRAGVIKCKPQGIYWPPAQGGRSGGRSSLFFYLALRLVLACSLCSLARQCFWKERKEK